MGKICESKSFLKVTFLNTWHRPSCCNVYLGSLMEKCGLNNGHIPSNHPFRVSISMQYLWDQIGFHGGLGLLKLLYIQSYGFDQHILNYEPQSIFWGQNTEIWCLIWAFMGNLGSWWKLMLMHAENLPPPPTLSSC